jgi:hypothetical protein
MRLMSLVVAACFFATVVPAGIANAAVCNPVLGIPAYQYSASSTSIEQQQLVLVCQGAPTSGGATKETRGAPSGYYRNSTTGNYSYYENGQITPAPENFTCSNSTCLRGANISFFEQGQSFPNGTTCQKTFCLLFNIRQVGNWNVTTTYRFTGNHDSGMPYEKWAGPYTAPLKDDQYDLGRPAVTGADAVISQPTDAHSCTVETTLTWTSVEDPKIFDKITGEFHCAQS